MKLDLDDDTELAGWRQHPYQQRVLSKVRAKRQHALARLLAAARETQDVKVLRYVLEHEQACDLEELISGEHPYRKVKHGKE